MKISFLRSDLVEEKEVEICKVSREVSGIECIAKGCGGVACVLASRLTVIDTLGNIKCTRT